MLHFLALGVVGASAAILASTYRTYLFTKKQLEEPSIPDNKLPKAAIIAPTKDLDPDFEENMLMLLEQDYPNYEVYYATTDQNDENYPALKQIVENADQTKVPAHLYFGGFSKKRCQKLDNIITVIDNMADDVEAFAFVDSDSRITKDWLRHMIAPLDYPGVGGVTGYRWYIPEKYNLITYLMALWTGFQFAHFHAESVRCTWGGSMSVKREVYEKLNVREKWEYALSDDCVLNDVLREHGYKVHFSVRAMTSSLSCYPIKELLIFAVRQAVIGKKVIPKTWAGSVVGLTFLHASMASGVYTLIKSIMAKKVIPKAVWGTLSFIPASVLQSYLILKTIKLMSKYRPGDRMDGNYSWSLFGPLAYNFLWLTLSAASLTDKFVWRDIYYRMISPFETDIYKYPERLDNLSLPENLVMEGSSEND